MENNKIFILLKKINDRFEAKANADCQKEGLTLSQFRVLIYLDINSNKIVNQKEMEVFFNVSHPTITGVIKRLEKKALITTNMIMEKGKQQKQIFISPKGKKSLSNMRKNQVHDDEMLKKHFSSEEIEKFTEYMSRLYQALTE